MCNFMSAIVTPFDGVKGGVKIYHSHYTDSHEDLCRLFKLRDKGELARVEFKPDSQNAQDYAEPEKYKLKIDEERTPEWFDAEKQEFVAEIMRGWVKSMIIDGEVDLLCGGAYILKEGAKINTVGVCVIKVICGGTISDIRGGTISDIRGGTISAISGGTISVICGGTISAIWGDADVKKDHRENKQTR